MVGKNKNPPANEVTPSRFTSFFSIFLYNFLTFAQIFILLLCVIIYTHSIFLF